jgi:hypothetical protein
MNLGYSRELLQETKHFCGWDQQKVAKIVPYALPKSQVAGRGSGGLFSLPGRTSE